MISSVNKTTTLSPANRNQRSIRVLVSNVDLAKEGINIAKNISLCTSLKNQKGTQTKISCTCKPIGENIELNSIDIESSKEPFALSQAALNSVDSINRFAEKNAINNTESPGVVTCRDLYRNIEERGLQFSSLQELRLTTGTESSGTSCRNSTTQMTDSASAFTDKYMNISSTDASLESLDYTPTRCNEDQVDFTTCGNHNSFASELSSGKSETSFICPQCNAISNPQLGVSMGRDNNALHSDLTLGDQHKRGTFMITTAAPQQHNTDDRVVKENRKRGDESMGDNHAYGETMNNITSGQPRLIRREPPSRPSDFPRQEHNLEFECRSHSELTVTVPQARGSHRKLSNEDNMTSESRATRHTHIPPVPTATPYGSDFNMACIHNVVKANTITRSQMLRGKEVADARGSHIELFAPSPFDAQVAEIPPDSCYRVSSSLERIAKNITGAHRFPGYFICPHCRKLLPTVYSRKCQEKTCIALAPCRHTFHCDSDQMIHLAVLHAHELADYYWCSSCDKLLPPYYYASTEPGVPKLCHDCLASYMERDNSKRRAYRNN